MSAECVCGDEATTRVCVHWLDGDRVYLYCEDCAVDICEIMEGAEVLP